MWPHNTFGDISRTRKLEGMSVEDLLIHFQYGDEDIASEGGRSSSSARQYYIPGDILKGIVSLHTTGRIRVRAVTLYLLGTATVSWEAPRKKKVWADVSEYNQNIKLFDNQVLQSLKPEAVICSGITSQWFSIQEASRNIYSMLSKLFMN